MRLREARAAVIAAHCNDLGGVRDVTPSSDENEYQKSYEAQEAPYGVQSVPGRKKTLSKVRISVQVRAK